MISTACLTIEITFGILRARRRIFTRPIKAEDTEKYIWACLCLHNYLRQTENVIYSPTGFVDPKCVSGKIKACEWRKEVSGDGCMSDLARAKGGLRKTAANDLGEYLKHYVNSDEGSCPMAIVPCSKCWKST